MSVGQIAANAVLGLIPIVDQILDCRDVVANCRQISKDKTDTWAWVALCLTLIGLIPILGSAVKGVLKILFLFLRKAGGDVVKVITPALQPIFAFLNDPKVKKILGNQGAKDVLLEVSTKLNELASSIKEGLNKSSCLSMWIKACYSRRVPNVNSGSIVEVLNKEFRLLDHALRVFQRKRHTALRLFERYLHYIRVAPYLTISLKD